MNYQKNGWTLLENIFDPTAVKQEATKITNSNDTSYFIYEDDGKTIRSVFSPHLLNDTVNIFAKQNPAIPFVKKILGDEIYLHQSHFNYKKANTGKEYAWHSDYTFWKTDDNMHEPNAVSAFFLLDDMTIENGPLIVLESSQDMFVPKKPTNNGFQIKHDSNETNGMISENMVSKTHLKRHTVVGNAGDVILMHCNLWHTSQANKSQKDRNVLVLAYNSLHNKTSNHTRPEYIVSRDFSPI